MLKSFPKFEKGSVRACERGAARLPTILVATLLFVVVVVLFVWFSNSEPPPAPVPEESPPAVEPETNAPVAIETNAPTTATTITPPVTLPEPTSQARGMVSKLIVLTPKFGEVPPEMAMWWQRRYQEVKESGPDGAAAICEFLARNEDVSFDEGHPEFRRLGFPTLRAALLDALKAIGGQVGIDASRQVLRTTSLPSEVAQLAQNLEQLAPRRYQSEILEAARAVLAQAQAGELPGYDVGPLFQILIRYGGADVVADLRNAGSKWKNYSAIALARLPRGVGVTALIGLTRSAANDIAWPMVAEHAAKSDEARDALFEAARGATWPSAEWVDVARTLGGYEFHICAAPNSVPAKASYENGVRRDLPEEKFLAVSNVASLSTAEINTRIGLIDQISTLNPPDAGRVALAKAKETLTAALQRRK